MSRREVYRRELATLGFFTLTAGDLWRYLFSWWGWGVICVVLVILAVIELVHARVDLRRLPFTLIGFLVLTVISIFWSDYPGATAVGLAATFTTTVFAIFLATVIDLETMLRAFGLALRWILGLSLLFEFVVAAFIRHPVLPFFVDYSKLDKIPAAFYWSRDLLFHGGQIQGIQGNSNLLALVALLALIVFGVQWVVAHRIPGWLAFWGIVAVATLALTRSSTVLIALAAVILVAVFLGAVQSHVGRQTRAGLRRRCHRRTRHRGDRGLRERPDPAAARQERRADQPHRDLGACARLGEPATGRRLGLGELLGAVGRALQAPRRDQGRDLPAGARRLGRHVLPARRDRTHRVRAAGAHHARPLVADGH